MYRRSIRNIAALGVAGVALVSLSGCVQMTRHSNTMVFGTSTTVGVKAGQNANQVPELIIGYDRQEAVIMPLLANTTEGSSGLLSPCDPVDGKDGGSPPETIHPCKFVGARSSQEGVDIQDSYSVLASFGAQIEGSAKDTRGAVGLAQYFATGVAAQVLAATGGAAVVAVGDAAKESAEDPNKANAAAAVLGSKYSAPRIEREVALIKTIDGPWKCGNPQTEPLKFKEILEHAQKGYPAGDWQYIEQANSIEDARFRLNDSPEEEMKQFLDSQKAVCGE